MIQKLWHNGSRIFGKFAVFTLIGLCGESDFQCRCGAAGALLADWLLARET